MRVVRQNDRRIAARAKCKAVISLQGVRSVKFRRASYRSKGHRHMHILFINWDNVKTKLLESSILIRKYVVVFFSIIFFC